MNPEETVLNFAAATIRSIWAMELLFALKSDPERSWTSDELIRELRSSQMVVAEALNNLLTTGLVVEEEAGRYRYRPGSPSVDGLVTELQTLYASKPVAVIRAIVTSPNKKLQILSDAFRIKE
jgi:hypothetical protein